MAPLKEAGPMARLTKSIARKILADVPDEKRFWLADGKYLKNLAELQLALVQMSPETFRTHSNWEKTDFSNWVKDVMGDESLAAELLKSETQEEAATVVAERLNFLKSKIA
jgi:hypothetical protein